MTVSILDMSALSFSEFLRNLQRGGGGCSAATRSLFSFQREFSSANSNVGGVDSQTIYALATGGIRCALAVIRVSGPSSGQILQTMGKFHTFRDIEPRKAILRRLYDPKNGKVIDHGLVLWFPGPRSFTGEDSCEFHVHGGPAVVAGMLEALGSFPECRMAGPGEFSKRGFLNGKMDLTAVEGLSDLIAAETEMQRVQAFSQMSGKLGSLYRSWRDRVAKCLASAEAYIDFGEDQNIESEVMENVDKEVLNILKEMREHLSDKKKGEILRNGVRVAILGRPNVGKSSLLNLLSKRDAAIVSSIPGTTRDIVETCIDLKGYPIIFADTAGIRSSPDEIEKEGIRRAFLEAQKANIILLVMSYEDVFEKISRIQRRIYNDSDKTVMKSQIINSEFQEIAAENVIPHHVADADSFLSKVLLVLNKVDLELKHNGLIGDSASSIDALNVSKKVFDASISCKNLHGLDHLTESLAEKVATICYDPKNESPYLTRERHRSHLKNCTQSLQNYLEPDELDEQDLALRTQHLKIAMNSIGYITGHLGTEDILDIIFKDFCIGK